MITFMLTFVLFLVVITAMAIGYLLQKKKLRGSCGGITALGLEKSCNCVNSCKQPAERYLK